MTTPTETVADGVHILHASRWTSIRFTVNLVGALVLAVFLLGWTNAHRIVGQLGQSVQRMTPPQGAVVPTRGTSGVVGGDETAGREYRPTPDASRSDVGTLRRLEDEAGRLLWINGAVQFTLILAGFVLFNRAVTRQERDEEAMRQALKAADAASEAKTGFLATVSHEIRTPLNAVSGMSELLLDTPLDLEQRQFAEAVHRNAEALSLLIGDLLDSSRIEAGQVFLESAPFDLRELVEGVAEILVVRAEVKGVELILDVAPDIPRQFVGDRNRLQQVLMNLVGNGVKFTEHGEVRIRVRADSSDPGTAIVRLAVIDTGIGIASEAQARVFERFVQADLSTVRRYGGTGLGLNISRSLVALMGGTLSLESQLGRGSTFEARVTLPIAAEQPSPDFDTTSLRGVEVLVIQPNQALRETLVTLLEFAGATVQAVGSAADAFALISDQADARVIVVGERLPDSSGLELAKKVWHDHDGAAGPGTSAVLLCSLRAMATRYLGSYGIAACVYKPIKAARLIQAVRQAAGLEEQRRTPEDEARGTQASAPAVRPRILMAEDNHDNWTLAKRFLGDAGYDVVRAENGVKAVDEAAAFRYDLILMDVELPLIDGMEATRQIRARERDTGQDHVPIVALTAHAVESVRTQALAAGMDDYATKPIQKVQILTLCARWIEKRPSVLVADDAPESHVLLRNYLGANDYRLVGAFNGREALDAFARQRFSLVLLDIDMPVMDGYEAARAIRGAPAGDVVPIVALTGYDGPRERQRLLAAGFNAHLSKPIRRVDLLATVTGLLGQPASVRREQPMGASASAPPAQARSPAAGTSSALPVGRDAANQADRLLALRDFAGLAAMADGLEATAKTLRLNRLAAVSEEVANAAHFEDAERSAWWGDQLSSSLDEAQRILAVRQSAGTPAGGVYDSLARVATLLLGVPLATITLVEDDRVHIQGGAGLPALFDGARVVPLSQSFSRVVTEQRSPLLVEDVRTDPRLRETIAAANGLMSLAGVPLSNAQGVTFGAFSAMDSRPHRWPPEEVAMLEELACIAVRMLEMERQLEPPATTHSAAADAAGQPSAPAILITVEDDIADLVPDYVAARREDVVTLHQLVEAGDFDAIRRLGHKMKGSGEGYGLPEVSRIGTVLERAARDGDSGSIRQLIARLDDHLARLRIRPAGGRGATEP